MQLEPQERKELEGQLSKAKIELMAKPDTAFFVSICMGLVHLFAPVGTACTNGRWIKYDPEFWQKQSRSQQVGLMLHKLLHVAFNHMDRLKERDASRWNVACDYVINLMIIDRGFQLPEGGLLDEQYRDMSAEQVYHSLEPEDCQDAPDHLEPPDGPPEEWAEELDQILTQAKIQSEAHEDAPGTIPGEIEFYLQRLLTPKLSLKHQLKRYFNDFARNDYTYAKRNPRFRKVIMPTMHSPSMGEVAVAVDASYSVTDDEFDRQIGEVGGIIRDTKPDKLTLIAFDREIRSEANVKNLRELSRVKFAGRGGTSIAPVMEWANERKPRVLVVFSDGGFHFTTNTPKPRVPVLWLIYNDPTFELPSRAWGKVIHFTIGDKKWP